MRALYLLVTVVIAVACRAAPQPVSSAPVDVRLDVADTVHERLELGLPLELEMKLLSPPTGVGSCTLSFDLWNEVYRAALSRHEILSERDAMTAMRRCVDMRKLQSVQAGGTAIVLVREAPAAEAYPVF